MAKGLRHLGKPTDYLTTCNPSLLNSLRRSYQRVALGLAADKLPFIGVDVWNHHEFTWLDRLGKPQVARARFHIPADSVNLLESKSMKLYLGSFADTRFEDAAAVTATLVADLSAAAGKRIEADLIGPLQPPGLAAFKGRCLDDLPLAMQDYTRNPGLLTAAPGRRRVRESLHTNLFRSLCPVTGQPDHGTVQVQYRGAAVSHEGLLRYLISYRRHREFGEQLAERIFLDIMEQCAPETLLVHIRFTRRGGIDINPVRARGYELPTEDMRLWWQ